MEWRGALVLLLILGGALAIWVPAILAELVHRLRRGQTCPQCSNALKIGERLKEQQVCATCVWRRSIAPDGGRLVNTLLASRLNVNYAEYIRSPEWRAIVSEVRLRSGNTCERCGNAPHQETHHLTYRRLGVELLDDLIGLCAGCHRFVHARSQFDPRTARSR